MKKLLVDVIGVGSCCAYANEDGTMSYNSTSAGSVFVPQSEEDQQNYKETMEYGEEVETIVTK